MAATERSGTIDFTVGNEVFQTWYKVVGDLKSGITPLVTLHGGPGASHGIVIPHAELNASHGRPVVFYDQVGGGQSTHLPDKPKEFWTPELFMDELDNVLAYLGIADEYDLLGHSWGGMLAAQYASEGRAHGLRRLVLVSAPASLALWEVAVQALLERMPQDVREMLKRHEAAGTTDDPEYYKGMQQFYGKHVCKIDPLPEDLQKAFAELEANPAVYTAMNGPSEFFTTGSLKTWTVVDKIHTITQPTLLINGADDEAQDVCMRPFFEKMPKVKWVTMMNSSHTSFFEERERYMEFLANFLATA
ncbi:proline-specific peptidase [Amylocystis lapponica]|nr:proline-specific peptidase [Amylocystis lapponica]